MKSSKISVLCSTVMLTAILFASCVTGTSVDSQHPVVPFTISTDDLDLTQGQAGLFQPVVKNTQGTLTVEQQENGVLIGGSPLFDNYALYSQPVQIDGFKTEFTYTTTGGFADEDGTWLSIALHNTPSYIGNPDSKGFFLLFYRNRVEGDMHTVAQLMKQPEVAPVDGMSVVVPGITPGRVFTIEVEKSETEWFIYVNNVPMIVSFDELPEDTFRNGRAFMMTGFTSSSTTKVYATFHRVADKKFYTTIQE